MKRERETQSFYAEFSICPKPRAAPAARPRQAAKVNRLLPTLKLDSPVRTQEVNSLTFFQIPKILSARFRCMTSFTSRGPNFLSEVSIVTSLNDMITQRA